MKEREKTIIGKRVVRFFSLSLLAILIAAYTYLFYISKTISSFKESIFCVRAFSEFKNIPKCIITGIKFEFEMLKIVRKT